jgi:hypothetical protein
VVLLNAEASDEPFNKTTALENGIYNISRLITLYLKVSYKFVWIFTNEHEQVFKKLGSFIEEYFLLRGHN